MTEEKQVLLMLKGLVSELTPEGKERYEAAYTQIQAIRQSSDEAQLALIVIGGELAAN